MALLPVLYVLLGVLALLDVATTRRALRRPGRHEANPLVARLMQLGPAWIAIKLGLTALGGWLLRDHPAGLTAIVAVMAVTVWNNARLGR